MHHHHKVDKPLPDVEQDNNALQQAHNPSQYDLAKAKYLEVWKDNQDVQTWLLIYILANTKGKYLSLSVTVHTLHGCACTCTCTRIWKGRQSGGGGEGGETLSLSYVHVKLKIPIILHARFRTDFH